MRCFIAIELDEQIKERLLEARKLFQSLVGKISWVKSEQMHLTIKFLGSVPDSKIPEITKALNSALADSHIRPFEFSIEGLGAFPERGGPRILWAGVNSVRELQNLHESIEKELELIDIPREQREFTPHLTLARIRSRIDSRECRKILENNADFSAGIQRVEHITLFSSELKPSGAVYRAIEKFKLIAQ